MKTITCIACAFLFAGTIAWGQGTTARISGTVKDTSGLPVADAAIQVTQTATGLSRTTTSSQAGTYAFAELPIGPYMLEVGKPGFSKYVQSGILLQVDSSPSIDPVLKVGSVAEQVTINADASLVETHTSGVGTVVDNQRVVEMPINGRNVTELVFLAGMATIGGTNGGTLNSNRNYPTVMISVAGGIANWTTYNWDGETHNDAYNSLNLPLPFPDALQEFKVESSALAAQYGQHASANVNVATKSGTNALHGNAFEFLRNSDLNSRDFFAPVRDTLKRNQFGGTVGGPVRKDKLFFFVGYQSTILHTTPSSNVAYIPDAAILSGDFTAFASPACNSGKQFNLSAAAGFTNNQISPSMFSAPAQKIAAILPSASANQCGKVTYGLPGGQTENMGVAKMDWQINDKESVYIRPFATNLDTPSTYDGKNALTSYAYHMNFRVYSVAIGDTYVIGSNMVNSFRVGLNRSTAIKIPDDPGYSWEQFGVAAPYQPTPNPRFTISGGNGFQFEQSAAVTADHGGPNFNINEDYSWVRGSHQLAFGATYNHVILNYSSGTNAGGTMTFNGTATGLGMADFMLGDATTWAQGNVQNVLYDRQNYIGMYAQDSWKATSRLTVNYGLRWEPFFAFTNKHGYFDHFDESLFLQNVHSTLYPNAPAGLFFPGDPQWTPGGNSIANNRYGVFLPRLGLAYDPFGDGKTTIRASVGMFTDRGALYSMSAMAQDAPYGTALSIPNVPMANPWATTPGGNPLPFVLTPNSVFPTFASYVTAPFNWKPTWVNQFNFGIQRQIGADWLVTANYVGNTISHLIVENQINPAAFLGTGPCTINGTAFANCGTTATNNQRRLLYLANPSQGQYYGEVSVIDDGGTGSYNALYLQLQKRFSKGLNVLSNYTWSHCISDLWNGNPGNNGASAVTPGNIRNDRGNCFPSDQRQVYNLSVVYQTPKFSNRMLTRIASDWQFAPIMNIKSAQFYNVTTGTDVALNGETTLQRPNLVAGVSPYVTDHNACTNAPCIAWGNPAAFVNPAIGTLGTVSLNSLKGPGIFQFDMALSRTFAIRER
ncbi:MAG: TonB-dependent receptor, partial [Bryobacteraceae bacterium]